MIIFVVNLKGYGVELTGEGGGGILFDNYFKEIFSVLSSLFLNF